MALNFPGGAVTNDTYVDPLGRTWTFDGARWGLTTPILADQVAIEDTAADFTATDVEGALAELQADHESDAQNLTDHLSDTSDAHDASAISIADAANDFTATDVEGALAELQADAETDATDLANHLSDTSDAHDASAISSVAAGNLAATDVQAALNELDTEKAAASHVHAGGDITTGTVGTARLGTGTADGTTFLRGDQTWATPAGGGSVATDAIWDAKGDLAVGTGANTAAKLTAGTDGYVLAAASTEATGLKWIAGGGGGAPTTAQYVTLATDAGLSAERVLTAGTGIDITDAGANGAVTIDVDPSEFGNGTVTIASLDQDVVQRSIRCVIDGGGGIITTGAKKFYLSAPYDCSVTGWRLISDVSTTTTLDVWNDTFANHPPTVADTMIASGTKPALSAASKNEDLTIDWSDVTIAEGSIIEVNVDSNSAATLLVLEIFVTVT